MTDDNRPDFGHSETSFDPRQVLEQLEFIELKEEVARRLELPQMVPVFRSDLETELDKGLLSPALLAAGIEGLKLVKPDTTEYDRFLGRYYLLEGHRALEEQPPDQYQAQRNFQKALDLEVGEISAEAAFYLGNLLFDRDSTEAERMYRLSIELNPGVSSTHFELAILLRERRDLPGALEEFEKAYRLEPNNLSLLNEIADTQMMGENYEQALAALTRAYEIEPEYWLFPVKIGLAEYRLGRLVSAAKHMRLGLDNAPDELEGDDQIIYIEGLYYLGLVYRDAGDATRARKLFKAVLNLAPGYEPAQLALDELPRK
jgi:tetratricopeptide (TPR) repeat protein